MEKYKCEFCNYETSFKANYKKHIQTPKHKKKYKYSTEIQPKFNQNSTEIQPKFNRNSTEIQPKKYKKSTNIEYFDCKYCGKPFKHMQSMYRHIKYRCEHNKDEDLKELVRLLNAQIQQNEKKIQLQEKKMVTQEKQLDKQNKQIKKLMCKLEVNHVTNNHIIQNNHIQLLSYNETDTTHLTENDYIQCLKKVTYCVKHLIEKIHFNNCKPENRNIYISNMKDKYIMVYENNNWCLKQKDKEIDDMYDKKEMLLEDWINEYKHIHPEMIIKFNKYLNNKEDDETMNDIKESIKLMMYNHKPK
jgi:hypothetical protein